MVRGSGKGPLTLVLAGPSGHGKTENCTPFLRSQRSIHYDSDLGVRSLITGFRLEVEDRLIEHYTEGHEALASGPTRNGAEILSLETTLTPGLPEKNAQRLIYLWPGITDQAKSPRGDLVQTTILGGASDARTNCGAKPTQWCMNPVTQHGLQATSRSKPWKPIDHDGQYKIVYNKTEAGVWTQATFDVKGGGKPFHALFANGNGVFKDVQFQTELWNSNPGTVSDHFYTSTRIVLSKADPGFGKTGRHFGKGRSSATPAETADGGKTWTIAKVTNSKMREGTLAA
ncbi:hypothetical protein FKW77_003168 [Venturia effusa]|uniref:Uncharacterized protein n=1 Tax=Venturia effusa TaxID=50376 RepID=A0A517LF45_9PEZI|nr:hypothetical protein FKW77_003168 [Venturia effusa]